MEKKAIISDCQKYRYRLERTWDSKLPKVMFLMLNPSTADANKDDRTIRRCINFAKSWGYGGILVGNLFAYRATEPKDLLLVHNKIGDQNKAFLDEMFKESMEVVCAWGNARILDKCLPEDYKPLQNCNAPLTYLELSKDGTPKHPLYLQGNLSTKSFSVKINIPKYWC